MTPPRDQQSVEAIVSEAESALDELIRDAGYDQDAAYDILTRAIHAALTVHDEALPGDWTTDGTQNGWWEIYCGETWLASIQGEISAKAVTAAHNSARRLLVDALRKIEQMPWPDSKSPYALIAREALQPCSTQKL